MKTGTTSTLQTASYRRTTLKIGAVEHPHISEQSVTNQTNLKMVKTNSPKHLASVYKSTRRHIQEYSNLYFSVGLTLKRKQTRSLCCFVHQRKAVSSATSHITHHTSLIKCLLSIKRTSNIPFVLEHHLSTTDDSCVCVCVRARARACVRAIFLALQEESGDPEPSYSRSNTQMINYIVIVTCAHIFHHSDYSLYFKVY